MAAYNQSSAYDINRYQPKKRQVKRPALVVSKPSAKEMRRRALVAMRLRFLAAAMVVVAVIVAMIYSRAILTEYNQKISAAEAALDVKKSESVRLNAELENKVSMKNIEEYAQQELGMTKVSKEQIVYVDMSEGDKVVVTSRGTKLSLFDRIQMAFSNVQEYIDEE